MPRRLSLLVVVSSCVASAALLVVAPSAFAQTTPSPAEQPGADIGGAEDQVVLSGTVAVPKGRSVGEVVIFHGRALVAGVVAGDVVVLDGPIVIAGQVSGSVVALNGPVRLGPAASVGGDVLGAHGVRMEPGALVVGQTREDVRFTPRTALGALGSLLGPAAIGVSVLLLMLLGLAVVPRGLDRVAAAGRTAPFASFGWGALILVALPVIALAAVASILALPLGLALFLGFGMIALTGYAMAATVVGRLVVPQPRGRLAALFAGWAIAAALGLVPYLNVVAWTAGSAFGVGCVLVATWRARAGRPTKGRHRAGYAGLSPAASVSGLADAGTAGDSATMP
jgi:hypothetical protein